MTTWPAWAWMWTVAALIYAGCKWITWHAAPAARGWRQAAYLLAWPGLDAPGFLAADARAERVRPAEWRAASGCAAAGVLLFFAVARTVPSATLYVTGWVGMVGLVLMLHFGALHLLSCAWRTAGVQARPLMHRPLAATSLADFWGRRWNTAFRDLTHRFLFRPLASRLGSRSGIVTGFLFSGAVHDLVISVPAGGGYGGPTAYFALQGAAMLFERSATGRRLGLGCGWRGWLFAMSVLVAPVQLLFHRPFVVGVVVPFMRALGAIS